MLRLLHLPYFLLITQRHGQNGADFTGKWYVALFQNEQIMNALYTTLIIALLSAFIATLIGTAAALGIQSMKRKPRTLMMGITNIPMLNADIVTGISLMLLFIAMGTGLKYLGIQFSLGFATVLIAHITFNIPYVILSVMPKLKQTKRSVQGRIGFRRITDLCFL